MPSLRAAATVSSFAYQAPKLTGTPPILSDPSNFLVHDSAVRRRVRSSSMRDVICLPDRDWVQSWDPPHRCAGKYQDAAAATSVVLSCRLEFVELGIEFSAEGFEDACRLDNFENQNANASWSKWRDLYSRIGSRSDRYGSFERWA